MKQEKSKGLGSIFAKAAGVGALGFAAMSGVLTALHHTPADSMTLGGYFGALVAAGFLASRVQFRSQENKSCCEHHKPKEP